jgi:hypothetical protein
MSKLKNLWQDVRKASEAFSYADLGENLSGSQKDAALDLASGIRPSSAHGLALSRSGLTLPRKHVAHVASSIRPGALRYAINVSQRMDAELDILSPPGSAEIERALDRYRSDLDKSGVRWRLLWQRLSSPLEIANYVREHRDVLFVVVSAQDALARAMESGNASRAPCDVPWIMVTEDLALA